jgi:hypothetical protein
MTEGAAFKVCPLCGARGKSVIFEPNARTWLCADGAACSDRYFSGKQRAETTNQPAQSGVAHARPAVRSF